MGLGKQQVAILSKYQAQAAVDKAFKNELRSRTTGRSPVPYMAHVLGVASLVLGDVSDPDL